MTTLPLQLKRMIDTPQGKFGHVVNILIGGHALAAVMLSYDASHVIPLHVPRLEASRGVQIPSPPTKPSVDFVAQPRNPAALCVNYHKPRRLGVASTPSSC
jgi:hypothetical protein